MLLVHAASLAFTTEVQAKDVEGWVKTPKLMPGNKNEEEWRETRTRLWSTSFLPGTLLAHESLSWFPFQRRENQEITCPGSNRPEFESQLLDFPSTSALSLAAHYWWILGQSIWPLCQDEARLDQPAWSGFLQLSQTHCLVLPAGPCKGVYSGIQASDGINSQGKEGYEHSGYNTNTSSCLRGGHVECWNG